MHLGLIKLAEPLDETHLVGIDQNVRDGGILEQRLDRAISNHFRDDFLRKDIQLFLIERKIFGPHIIRDVCAYLSDEFFVRELFKYPKVKFVDNPRMKLEFLV